MRVIKSVKSVRTVITKAKLQNRKIGFVPTMGALHEGHLSLVRKARRENDLVVLSIFVNPKQFGPHEDFRQYPREEKKDKMLAKKEKVDIIFYPSEKDMYPAGFLTYINVEQISKEMCGKFRPGHFKGVTTVVGKLLNMVMPDALYVGQKDAQQAVVLKRMIRDLNFPVQVHICPTRREDDGLALSSRNSYLAGRQRQEATVLYKSLMQAKQKILKGEHNTKDIIRFIGSFIKMNSSGEIDYIECVNADSLEPLKRIKGRIMIALAVRFGKTRLIDNIVFGI